MPSFKYIFGRVFAAIIVFSSCSKHNSTPPSGNKALTSITFTMAKNPGLLQDVTGETVGDTVYVSTFAGTDVSALKAELLFEGNKITVGSAEQVSGATANNFTTPVTYSILAEDGTQKNFTVKFIDTGIPVVYINTNNVPITSKDNYVVGSIKLVGGIGGAVLYEGATSIKGRGNSTWGMPKKPYRLKLDKKATLLGMPENKNWVLLANYADKSLMRNELAFEMSRRAGLTFTPKSTYVEVVLNNEYEGNYEMTEQVKQGKAQVDIEEQPDGATTLPAIAGGYLVEVDGFAAGEPAYFYTSHNMPVTIKYPGDDVITNQQKQFITNHFQKFEDALFAGNFGDPVNGYQKYFDLDSYVNYYLVNEVMGNSDIFWSTNMYKKKNDDRIYSGPVWDFDIAANNDERLGDAVNKLMLNAAHEPKMWINRLMQDSTFRRKVRSRWNELKDAAVKTLPGMVDELALRLKYSQQKNYQRWHTLNEKVYLELQVAGTYTAEIAYLKNYLIKRISWLDTQFNSPVYQ